MGKRLISLVVLLCFIAVISGCASIIHGKLQKISITTEPIGATVRATNGERCTTPGVLEIDRSLPLYTLHIEKEGYEPMDITLNRNIDPWFFGNILIGGIIGIIVDLSTGAAYKFSPDKINEVLASKGVDVSKLDTEHKTYVFIDLKEKYPNLDLSELQRIN